MAGQESTLGTLSRFDIVKACAILNYLFETVVIKTFIILNIEAVSVGSVEATILKYLTVYFAEGKLVTHFYVSFSLYSH